MREQTIKQAISLPASSEQGLKLHSLYWKYKFLQKTRALESSFIATIELWLNVIGCFNILLDFVIIDLDWKKPQTEEIYKPLLRWWLCLKVGV